MLRPDTPAELAAALGSSKGTVALAGNQTKALMAGPRTASDVEISTMGLDRVLKYEPADLTISVEAGMLYRDLTNLLARNRQMIPLDPPFADTATVGGILSANTSGPRRRLYGSARDMVIGMTFATLEGKLVQTGGMVVKNVAGLDMAKMLIGSFGTLAAIATVNFKLTPMPQATRTFVRRFRRSDESMAARDAILKSVLQPAALDLVNTGDGFQLLAQASGNEAVLDRWSRELPSAQAIHGEDEERLWSGIRETVPTFLAANPEGAVVRVACALTEVGRVLEAMPTGSIARAGTGVCYGLFRDVRHARGRGLIEFAPHFFREQNELWPAPGSDFAMMEKVKWMFDPDRRLNRGRLYGRL
jgi:glycolate oxidase FAD binding subunit